MIVLAHANSKTFPETHSLLSGPPCVGAESLLLEAQAISERCRGSDHPDTARWLVSLGDVYRNQGRCDEAIDAHQRVLAIVHKHPEANSVIRAKALKSLGVIFAARNSFDEAERFLKQLVEVGRSMPRGGDAWVSDAQKRLVDLGHARSISPQHWRRQELMERAVQADRESNFPEAERSLLDALALAATFGPQDALLTQTHFQLGKLYARLRRVADAERHYACAVTIERAAGRTAHVDFARYLGCLGSSYLDLQKFADAERALLEARDLAERFLGSDHSPSTCWLLLLGRVWHHQDRLDESENAFRRVLTVLEKQPEANPDIRAEANKDLGILLYARRCYDKAEPFLRRAFALGQSLPSLGDAWVARVRQLLVDLDHHLSSSSEHEHFQELFEQALKALREDNLTEGVRLLLAAVELAKTFGLEDTRLAQVLTHLGRVYLFANRFAEAEECLLRSLAIARPVLGTSSPFVLETLGQLGRLYQFQQKLPEAERALLETCALNERVRGIGHASSAKWLDTLATVYCHQGRFAEAKATWHQALAILKKEPEANLESYLSVLDGLGRFYYLQQSYDRAGRLLRRAYRLARRIYGPKHWWLAGILRNLADLDRVQGRLDRMITRLRRAYRLAMIHRGPHHLEAVRSLDALALTCFEIGELEEAQRFFKGALAINRKLFGPGHVSTIPNILNLGRVAHSSGDFTRAERLCRRALRLAMNTMKSDHPHIVPIVTSLGMACAALGRDAEAEKYFRRALILCEETRGPSHAITAQVRIPYCEFLRTRGREQEALELERLAREPPNPAE